MNILNTTGCEIYSSSIVKGDGCYVIDNCGKKYIDFESGVWALPLGHNNIRINNAIIEQLNKISHTAYRYTHPVVEEAGELLLNLMHLEDGKCLFLSSGSEAVEFAIRVVNKISDRQYLLKLSNHYLAAYGTSGNTNDAAWISIDWQTSLENSIESTNYDDLLREIPFDKVRAFVIEAGNASGNVKLPPKSLIQTIVAKVKQQNGWVIADEVTVGMGRTGKWFGFEHYEIQPDIIACGKGLGNGYPVSAVGICKELYNLLIKSDLIYGQSHQNDPLGCAVAKAVIISITEMHLLDTCIERGAYLNSMLSELKNKHSCIKEIRGIGLLYAMEFNSSMDSQTLSLLHKMLFDRGYIVGLKLATNVIRFYPPLIIEKYMIEEMVQCLDNILSVILQ